jgi:RimJ/RimL family protein N-acetyltransferase
MLSKRSDARSLDTCRRGPHVLLTEHLRLQSPTHSDRLIMRAAASDPEAQRWLGWHKQAVIPESRHERLLARQPGQGRRRVITTGDTWSLIAIDQSTGLSAGSVSGDPRDGTIGGVLAPQFRGRRLGAELFAVAAEFAHYHLGQEHVFAGAEPANVVSVRALLSAGFIPATGPDVHQLEDGRVIPSSWFLHSADTPTRCEA